MDKGVGSTVCSMVCNPTCRWASCAPCCVVQEVERPKMLERLGKWQAGALQELLDLFDLPTPSKGTKVRAVSAGQHNAAQHSNSSRQLNSRCSSAHHR